MAKATTTFNIQGIADLDVSKIINGINRAQAALKGLSLPTELQGSFTNLFSRIDKELTNFTTKASSSFKSMADVQSLNKSFTNLGGLLSNLQKEIVKVGHTKIDLTSNVNFQAFRQNIKTIEDGMHQFSESMSNAKQEIDKFGRIGTRALSGKGLVEMVSNGVDFNKYLQDASTQINAAIVEAERKQSEAQTKVTALINEKTAAEKKYADTFKSSAEADANKRITKPEKKEQLVNIQGIQQQIDLANASLIKAQLNTDTLKQKLTDIGTTQSILSALKRQFEDLGIPTAQKELEALKGKIESLKTDATKRLTDSLKEVNGGAQEAVQGLEGFKPAVQNIEQAAKRTQSFASELDMVKSRIAYVFSLTNGFYLLRNAIRSAYQSVTELDSAMTDIAVVTTKTIGDLWKQRDMYADIASDMGGTTVGLYNTAKLYYQQGLKENEVMKVSTETMKMARIAGMDYAKATDYMTAAIKGFKLEIEDATRVNDVFSQLAAKTAADTEEIASALTRTASIAKSAGMELETTSAFLTQMIETTREAPENLGTAMKTIIARFQELKKAPSEIGEIDGEIVDANKIEGALRQVGVALRDEVTGQFRDLDDVFLELASRWEGLDKNTQRYIATIAAGSRQQSRFIAMMDNYKRTVELVGFAQNSAGASQQQFEKTLDSLEAKVNQLKNAMEQFYMGLANSAVIKGFIDLLTGIINTINDVTDAFGDFGGAIGRVLIVFAGMKLGKALLTNILSGLATSMAVKKGQEIGSAVADGVSQGSAKKNVFRNFFSNFQKEVSKMGKSVNNLKSLDQAKNLANIRKQYSANSSEIAKLNGQINTLRASTNNLANANQIEKDTYNDLTKQVQTLKTENLGLVDSYSAQVGGLEAVTLGNRTLTAAEIQTLSARMANNGVTATQLALLTASETAKYADALASGNSAAMTQLETTAKLREQIAAKGGIAAKLMEISLAIKENGLKGLAIALTGAKVGADAAETAGLWAKAAALWATYWPLLAIAAVLAVVVGGIVLLSNAIKNASIEAQIERAASAAEAAKAAFSDANEALDDLLAAKDEYGDTQEALEQLTVGTDAWKQALIEANQQVLALLSSYPKLAEYIANQDGHLTIQSEGWDAILEAQREFIANAQVAQIGAQREQLQLESQKRTSDLADTMWAEGLVNVSSTYTSADGYVSGDEFQMDILSNNVDKLSRLFAENSQLLQGTYDETTGELQMPANFASEVTSVLLSSLTPEQQANEYQVSLLVDALWENRQALLDNGVALNNMDTQTKAMAQSLMAAKFSQNEAIAGSENANVVAQIASQNFDQAYKTLSDEVGAKGISDEERQQYADAMGYTWTKGNKFIDQSGQEVELKDSDISKGLGAQQAAAQLEEQGEQLVNIIGRLNNGLSDNLDGAKDVFSKLVTGDTSIESGAINDLISKLDIADSDINQMLASLSAEDLSALLGKTVENTEDGIAAAQEEFRGYLRDSALGIQKTQRKQLKGLIQSLRKTMKKEASPEEMAQVLAGLSDEQKTFMSNLVPQVETALGTGGLSEFWAGMTDIFTQGDEELAQRATEIFGNIDWSNPITAADALGTAVQSADEKIRGLAASLLVAGQDAYSSGAQFQYFVNSAEFSELQENIGDVIEENGKLNASNIEEIADSSENLSKILKNTGVSAEGLAKAITSLYKGEATLAGLTSRVLEAISKFDGLNATVERAFKTMEDFDPGFDEGEIGEWVNEITEASEEMYKGGEYGNTQLQNYLKLLFGEDQWNQALKDAEGNLKTVEKQFLDRLKVIEGNLYGAWEDLANDSTTDIFSKMADGSIFVDVGTMTTDQLVSKIAEAYNVSKEYAEFMLTDFKNFSYDIQAELAANDFTAGIKEVYDNLGQTRTLVGRGQNFGDQDQYQGSGIYRNQKFISEEEIAALAATSGKTKDEILTALAEQAGIDVENITGTLEQALAEKGIKITDFFDEDGMLKSSEEIVNQLNTAFSEFDGGTFMDSFITRVNDGGKIALEDLQNELRNLGIPEEALNGITEDLISAYNEGLDPDEQIQLTTVVNGEEVAVDLSEGLSSGVEMAQKEADWDGLAEAVATALSTVDATGAADSLQGAFEAKYSTITDGISNAIKAGVPTSLPDVPVKITPSLTKTTVTGSSTGATVRLSMYRKGTGKKGALPGPALVGEVAPELIQTKDGAFVAGLNGPEVVDLDRKDIVYDGDQTKQILKGGTPLGYMPRFATGYENPGSQTGGSNSGKGGKGGSADEWKNSYDWLYNLLQQINGELRTREKLEWQYNRALKDNNKSVKDLLKNYQAQEASLKQQQAYYEDLRKKRLDEANKVESEYKDLSKYAKYNEQTGLVEINWDEINKVKDSDKGDRIEEYISKLEGIQDSIYDAEDSLMDIQDQLDELKEQGKDDYQDLESRVLDAIIAREQEVIDNLGSINESINNSNTRLLDSIQKAIDEERRAREQENARQDIEEKQRRLALLQRDSSDANALEIKKLQDEIAQDQENYTDTLIDTKITELQDQNNEAAEQRERQIELLQNQLDYAVKNGEYWEEAYDLISSAFGVDGTLDPDSALAQLLQTQEGWDGLSNVGKDTWWNELTTVFKNALVWYSQNTDMSSKAGQTITFTDAEGNQVTGTVASDGSVTVGGKKYTGIFQMPDGTYQTVTAATEAGGGGGGGTPTPDPVEDYPYGKASTTSGNIKAGQKGQQVKAIQYALNKLGYGNSGTKSIDGVFGSGTTSAVKAFQRAMGLSADGVVGNKTRAKFQTKGYLKGGLADYTGPAWMDGTPSRPELVLDAQDTKNFLVLKDVLSDAMEGRPGTYEKGGDNYFEVHIEVDELANDYDVEQVAEKVKKIINADARYRNVNAINLLR